ncbi:hypothetical protein XENOCAPTIV_028100, partial [Xenoophorus captivus]
PTMFHIGFRDHRSRCLSQQAVEKQQADSNINLMHHMWRCCAEQQNSSLRLQLQYMSASIVCNHGVNFLKKHLDLISIVSVPDVENMFSVSTLLKDPLQGWTSSDFRFYCFITTRSVCSEQQDGVTENICFEKFQVLL